MGDDALGRVLAALEPVEPRAKRMFGGHGIYARDDTFFAIYYDDRLYFRVDDDSRPRYEQAGSRAFHPPKGRRTNSYYEVPDDVVASDRQLLEWAEDAIDAARGS